MTHSAEGPDYSLLWSGIALTLMGIGVEVSRIFFAIPSPTHIGIAVILMIIAISLLAGICITNSGGILDIFSLIVAVIFTGFFAHRIGFSFPLPTAILWGTGIVLILIALVLLRQSHRHLQRTLIGITIILLLLCVGGALMSPFRLDALLPALSCLLLILGKWERTSER